MLKFSNSQQQSATVSNSQQIDSAKFGESASFSSVAKAQARHLPARDAGKKKDVHARAQARLPDLRETFFRLLSFFDIRL